MLTAKERRRLRWLLARAWALNKRIEIGPPLRLRTSPLFDQARWDRSITRVKAERAALLWAIERCAPGHDLVRGPGGFDLIERQETGTVEHHPV